jgi:diadenylate cyclase
LLKEGGSGLADEKELQRALRRLAPGTPLREGLDNVLRARTGAIVIMSDSPAVLELADGGFQLDCEFTPEALYELAKMDGAIILSSDGRRIVYANTQLVVDPSIPSTETGIRHRTAERVARLTKELVIAISQRRNIISLYLGSQKYILRDLSVILSKANQALQTLEKYQAVLNQALINLSALEFEDQVTIYDVSIVVQRFEMVARIVAELKRYIIELGTEGRLVNMQMVELVGNSEADSLAVMRDYAAPGETRSPEELKEQLSQFTPEELLEPINFCRLMGYGASLNALEQAVSPRGYRIASKIPRLPASVVENLVEQFGSLQSILRASLEELDEVEGIGEVRARAIKDGLRRLQEQVLVDRHF